MDDRTIHNPSAGGPVNSPVHVSHAHKFIFGYFLMLILAAAAGGLYTWQHNKVKALDTKVSGLQSQLAIVSEKAVTTTVHKSNVSSQAVTPSSYATFTTSAYPLSIPNQKVTFTLSLPTGTYILPYTEDLGTGAGVQELFAASYNDIIGRWFFGAQPFEASNATSNSYLYVSAMSKWSETADSSNINYAFGSDVVAGDITVPSTAMTLSQKATLITQLASTTSACIKDPAQGFASKDGSFKYCYVVQPSRYGASIMNITGYALVDGQPVILVGVVDLNAKNAAAQAALNIQALKNTSISSTPAS